LGRDVRIWALALFSTAACQSTDTLPPPPIAEAESLVMLVADDTFPIAAYALDADAPLPSVKLPTDRDVVIWVWTFDQRLSKLGYVGGELDLTKAPTGAPPRPSTTHALRTPYTQWSDVFADELLAQLPLVKLPGLCDPYGAYDRVEKVAEGSSATLPIFTENARLGSMFVGNELGVWEASGAQVYRLTTSTTSTTGPTDLAENPFVGAHWNRLPPKEHYFYQADGRLWRTKPTTATTDAILELAGTNPGASDATYAWVTGSDDRSPFEVFVLDESGSIWRFDGIAWNPIRQPDPAEHLGPSGGIAWIGPNDIMTFGASKRLLRIQDGNATDVTPPGMATPTVILNELFVGVHLGDSEGQLWRSVAGTWTKLAAATRDPVLTIGPHAGGLLYGGTGGVLHYFRDDLPSCNASISASSTIFRTASLYEGETLLFHSPATHTTAAPITVTFLKPKR
jgi:hypothetical protein